MIKKILYVIVFSSMISGCGKEEKLSEHSVVERNSVLREYTELDKWIHDTFTIPYGIEVDYHWDKNNTQKGSYIYPPETGNIRKVLETIKELWIDLYTQNEFGGEEFFQGKNPVKIYMYGGKNLDVNGVELLNNSLSTASEMYLYNVNDFDPKNEEQVFILMRSVHHQFARRLMEIFPYDRDRFLSVSQNRYSPSTSDNIRPLLSSITRVKLFGLRSFAHRRGLFTLHSFLSAEDDFAEIISVKLTHTPKQILRALNVAKTPLQDENDPELQQKYNEEAKQAHKELTEKQDFVEEYFKKSMGFRLSRMQIVSVKRMKVFLKKQS